MFNILTHKGKANQDDNELLSHPSQKAIIKKINNNCFQRCRRKGALTHYWWGCKLVQPLRKLLWRSLKEQKLDLSYAPAKPLSVYI
jgi:hypothetical protein